MNIVWLKDVGKKDAAIAGGKGAQLGELKNAGFNVPEGFVITAEGCKQLLNETETAEKEIISAYRKLSGKVAVRSSAASEDQKETSFAGQMETYLNVTEDQLLETVKKCISSLSKAASYASKKNIRASSMAVVVQKMVDAKKAGVAFSVNPVSGNKDEIIIEAGKGLGKAVVGGEVIPDRYIISKKDISIKEKEINTKTPVLTEDETKKIALQVKKIEEHYSFPQDVEWAYDKENNLAILQSRPITAIQRSWKKIIAREYGVQYTELSLKCLSPLNKHIVPSPFYEQAYVPEDGNEACYVDADKWSSFVDLLNKKYVEQLENYYEFEEDFIRAGTEYMETAKKIANSNIKTKNNKELKKDYEDYLGKNLEYGPYIWMQFLINNFYSEKAKEIISAKSIGKETECISAMLRPEKKAAAMQISEIAEKWEQLSDSEKNQAYENFKWLPCLDVHNPPWTKEEFISHMSGFRKKENKEPAVKIDFSAEEKKIISIARKLSYLKDLKDDFRRQGVMHGQRLYSEIAGRIGISLEDASYMTDEEIIDFLEKEIRPKIIKIQERKKGFAIYFNNNKEIECKSGKGAREAIEVLGIAMIDKITSEIKGTPASKGMAIGKVTIIRGVSDLKKVRKGDIIVAVTTHPDYVPAMQRAAAIVTDEGGITSHAAIIAREYGLPCIVGARNATKLLKEGDKVEVNANSGSVIRLKM